MTSSRQTLPEAIVDNAEKKALLGDEMVRLRPALGVSTIAWAEILTELLIDLPTAWCRVNVELKDTFTHQWAARYGVWNHSAGKTRAHNKLGMAYAWWALHEVVGLSHIELSDSPDFRGTMILPESMHGSPTEVKVCGDIGRCTPVALSNGLRTLRLHDVWISVIDWESQVLIRFGYSPSEYLFHKMWSGLVEGYNHNEAIKRIFFCDGCNEWSITKKSRRDFLEWSKSISVRHPTSRQTV